MATKKILLVDDTKLFLELEKNFLRLSPVHILTASSGEEALAVIEQERPDLVFMDVHMPGMGGIACCRRIKSNPALNSIPVIMVTSSGKIEDVELCREAGCDGYVTKPIDRREFLEKARVHLQSVDRREPRVPFRTSVSFQVDGRALSGMSADLSSGGIYVECEDGLHARQELLLEIAMAGPENPPVRSRGVVAWENGPGNRRKPSLPAGFGVEFVEMKDRDSALVRSIIESRRSTG